MHFFTDRNLGHRFPRILREAGLEVTAHDDLFRPMTADVEWIPVIAERGMIAVTHDARIRYKPNELEKVRSSGLRLLVMQGAAPFPELAENFARLITRVEFFVSGRAGPWIAKVYRPTPSEVARNPLALGRVEHWYP